MDTESERRLEALRNEIRERLAIVCSGWEPDVFDALVKRIAFISFKYDLRARLLAHAGDKGSTARLIDEISSWTEASGGARQQRFRKAPPR